MLRPGARRSWLWAAVPFAVLLLAGCPGDDGEDGDTTTTAVTDVTTGPPDGVVHDRREINTFTDDEIKWYRAGVALMQSRAASDPTSWIYQASMHGYPDTPFTQSICPAAGPPQPAWATCEHGSFFFLSWHRMYLYYFERILRAAVQEAKNDPNYEFALPYWDYENPDNHDLPEPLRNPADSSNPLFVAKRTANCNNGSVCVSAATADDSDAMSLIPFCSCPGGGSCAGCQAGILSDESFGGEFSPGPEHSGGGPGELELQPHGAVHNAVGGPTGWMSYFECAARDPAFWLHHANIDRLWQVWLNQEGGRANTTNNTWETQTFTFFDENKQSVTMTGCEILNTISQLDYQYKGLEVKNVTLCGEAGPPPAEPAPAPPARKTLVTGRTARTNLGAARVSVAVPLPQAANQRILTLAGPDPGRVRLVIEGVKLLRAGSHYQVYLNLPEGATPDPESPNYVGNVALFTSVEHGGEVTRSFDITDEVAALKAAGQWTGELEVDFVPAHGEEALAAGGRTGPFVSFQRVSIQER